jgi:peptide/nickel transport system permease protein
MNGNFDGMLQGNLGKSLWSNVTVLAQIKDRWAVTLELGILGIICGQLFALPVGILSAIRQDTWGDYLGRSFAIICMAVPGFWVGTMILVFPSIWWGYMPPITYVSFFADPISNLKMVLPAAVVLGMAMTGTTMRMTRAMMLEVLRSDYVRTAWSKGLRERSVIVRHALKNALIPVITLVGLWLGVLIGGTVIIEQVFSLPGLGRLIVDAALSRDYPVISGVLLFFGCGMIFINLLVDLTYAYLDPRIRYQ